MCFILHIFDCDEREWCELDMGEFGRGESHSPYFYWGNIFVLNSIVLNLIWANSFGANRLFGMNAIGANVIWANAIRPYGEYNLSDCHFVGLFSLILPSLIIWVEFDCDECDWGECDFGRMRFAPTGI